TPCGAYTTLDGTKRLSVSMTTFKSLSHQFFPDVWQLIKSRTKHIDTLTAGYLSIQVILLGNPSYGDQLLRSDLSTCNTRYYRVSTTALYVRQVPVVGILYGSLLGNEVIPDAGQQRCNNRLAYLTAITFAMRVEKFIVCFNVFYLDDVIQLLTRIIEMFTNGFLHRVTQRLKRELKNIIYHGRTTATTGASFS